MSDSWCERDRKTHRCVAALARSEHPGAIRDQQLRHGHDRVEVQLRIRSASASKGWARGKPKAIEDLRDRRLLDDGGDESKFSAATGARGRLAGGARVAVVWPRGRDDEHLGAVSVAPDGTVVVAGDGLWIKSPEAKSFRLFERGFSKGGSSLGARGIEARAADDVWIALSCMEGDCAGPDGIHFDGARLTRVEKSWPGSVPKDRGFSREPRVEATPGGAVWLMGEQVLWRLVE